jgi:hypothetical protein
MTVGSVAGSTVRRFGRRSCTGPAGSDSDQSRSVIGVMDNILVLGKHQYRGPPIDQFTVVRLGEPITTEQECILVTLEPKT